jgi:hypothetical protein
MDLQSNFHPANGRTPRDNKPRETYLSTHHFKAVSMSIPFYIPVPGSKCDMDHSITAASPSKAGFLALPRLMCSPASSSSLAVHNCPMETVPLNSALRLEREPTARGYASPAGGHRLVFLWQPAGKASVSYTPSSSTGITREQVVLPYSSPVLRCRHPYSQPPFLPRLYSF